MRAATQYEVSAVVDWLKERGGEDLALAWLWECTPAPCGPPSYEQVEDGLRVASGELSMGDLLSRVHAEMDEAMAEWRASQEPSKSEGGTE